MTKIKTERDHKILSKALWKAADYMSISDENLMVMLSLSISELEVLKKNGISPKSELGELSILILQIYKGLSAKCSHDLKFMKHFLNTKNSYFRGKPIDIMKSKSGLLEVHNYLVAMGSKH